MATEGTVSTEYLLGGIDSVTSKNGILYAITMNLGALALFSSSDAGENWSLISNHDISTEIIGADIQKVSIVIDSNDTLHIVYYCSGTTFEGIVYRYYDGSWSAPVTIVEDGDPVGYIVSGFANLFSLTIDNSNQCHIAWIAHSDPDDLHAIFYNHQSGGVWQGEELVYQCVVGEGILTNICSLCIDKDDSPVIFTEAFPIGIYLFAILMWTKSPVWGYENVTDGIPTMDLFPAGAVCDLSSGDIYVVHSGSSIGTGIDIIRVSQRDYLTGVWTQETVWTAPIDTCMALFSGIDLDSNNVLSVSWTYVDDIATPTTNILYFAQKEFGVWGGEEIIYEIPAPIGTKELVNVGIAKNNHISQFEGMTIIYTIQDTSLPDEVETTDSYSLDFSGAGGTPTISGVTPDTGGVNKRITISGESFGATQQNSKVLFVKEDQEFEADIYTWQNTQIVCYSPEVPDIGNWDILVRIVSNV